MRAQALLGPSALAHAAWIKRTIFHTHFNTHSHLTRCAHVMRMDSMMVGCEKYGLMCVRSDEVE